MTSHDYIFLARLFESEGQWVALCPEFGVAAQGETFRDAAESIAEAVVLVVDDDLGRQKNPRRRADIDEWARLTSDLVRCPLDEQRTIPSDGEARGRSWIIRYELTLQVSDVAARKASKPRPARPREVKAFNEACAG